MTIKLHSALAASRNANDWRSGARGRFVVVRLNKGGQLPGCVVVDTLNSASTADEAARVLARIQGLNPASTFTVLDRASL